MANHLTPTELARESGLDRRDVIVKCVELGVPIFNGRIDKTLFLSSLRESPDFASGAASGTVSRRCSHRLTALGHPSARPGRRRSRPVDDER